MTASKSLVHVSVERLPAACVPLHMDPLGQAKHLLSFTYSFFSHTVAFVPVVVAGVILALVLVLILVLVLVLLLAVVVVVVVTVQLQSIHWSMVTQCAQRSWIWTRYDGY